MIVLPQFLEIERGILSDIPQIIEKNKLRFNKAIMLFDKNTEKIVKSLELRVLKLPLANESIEFIEVNDSSKEYVDIVRKRVEKGCCIFGVGGGKVIDVGKYAASLEDIDFISIPTCPSNDGICSPVAVIDLKSLGAKMPIGLIVDLDVIQKAPIRNIRAGIGDLISNLSAVEDWRLASREKGEKFDPFSALLAETGAFLVLNDRQDAYPTKHRQDACAIKPDIESYSFLKRLVYGLVLSGIAMAVAGSSRPCSGGEHEISHAIDELYGGKALHGEQVAVGTLFTLNLQKNKYFKRVRDFFKHCEVPMKYSDIGLTEEEFIKAISYAPNTRKERYTILEKLDMREEKISEVIGKVA